MFKFLVWKWIGYRDHVTPFLKEAHILPVQQPIDYKIALLAIKCINNVAPVYLQNLLTMRIELNVSLRNKDDYFLLSQPNVPNYKVTD